MHIKLCRHFNRDFHQPYFINYSAEGLDGKVPYYTYYVKNKRIYQYYLIGTLLYTNIKALISFNHKLIKF